MSSLINDVRIAIRGLVRHAEFTIVAVLTLALGIGANTAVFTLVDGVLLRPLPFPDAEQLVSIQHLGREGQDELPVSPGLYLLYRDQAESLSGIAMFSSAAANFVVDGQPERIDGQSVTTGFFDVLDVSPTRGRAFTPEEGRPEGPQVVLLSDGLWRSNYGADPNVIGQTVDMSGVRREVVGIMPPTFGYPDRTARFWIPFVINESTAPLAAFFGQGIARIAPTSSLDGVRAELTSFTGRLDQIFAEDGAASFLMNVNLRPVVEPLKDTLVGDVSRTLWILLGTVAFVLLIACANVANLLLVRVEGRRRELALRVALGADRLQVLRTFMGESLVLAAAGGTLGLVIAALAVRVTSRIIPTDLPRMGEVTLDLRILACTGVVSLGCAVFFAFLPLMRYGSPNLAGELREGGGRSETGGRQHHRLRSSLVVTQVALALVLLVGSGLMFRSFLALRSVHPGFDPAGVLTARIIVPSGEIADPMETARFFRGFQQRLESQPGVIAAGFVSAVPLGGSGTPFGVLSVEDHPRGPDELPIFAVQPQADVGYFEAMGIEVIEGRTFQLSDQGDQGRGAIVSESFARRWWPNSSPLGRGVNNGGPNSEWYRIVGVVEDVHQNNLSETPQDAVYFPTVLEAGGNVFPNRAQDVVIKTSGDPLAFVSVLRRELQALNPRIPFANPRAMDQVFDSATARTSFTLEILGAASAIALLLGLVGIYGVISYIVAQRTREIGLRMALGASGSVVRRMVVREGLVMAAIGVALGVIAAVGLSRLMGSLLFGVSAIDPATYLAVSAALVSVAAVASWVPALKAAGVDPTRALRAD
jgi:predicted permease